MPSFVKTASIYVDNVESAEEAAGRVESFNASKASRLYDLCIVLAEPEDDWDEVPDDEDG